MSLKFLGPNSGSTVDAVEAINYAVANGANISNDSWGYVGAPNRSLRDAITRADNTNSPSSYGNPNIISVAATDNRDTLASFSNFGASTVDEVVPRLERVQHASH